MVKKIFIIFCFASVLAIFSGFCDTVSLKNGKNVEGNILEKTDTYIKMNIEGVNVTYYLDEVKTINGNNVQVLQKETVKENVPPTQAQETAVSLQNTSNNAGAEPTQQVNTENNASQANTTISPNDPPLEGTKTSYSGRDTNVKPIITPRDAKIAVGIFAGLFFIIFIISVIMYVYSSICLYFIAKKTQKEPAWLSWVPIGNLFLMCKIAGLSYLWLLGLIVCFVPVIGIIGALYNVGLMIYVWYKIALARNKPGWLGILVIIPVLNLVIMGYLAFAE